MIDHTGVTVSDYKKSKFFYENALKPIGYKMLMEIPKRLSLSRAEGHQHSDLVDESIK
jgi:hypothetical protein